MWMENKLKQAGFHAIPFAIVSGNTCSDAGIDRQSESCEYVKAIGIRQHTPLVLSTCPEAAADAPAELHRIRRRPNEHTASLLS